QGEERSPHRGLLARRTIARPLGRRHARGARRCGYGFADGERRRSIARPASAARPTRSPAGSGTAVIRTSLGNGSPEKNGAPKPKTDWGTPSGGLAVGSVPP